jgi:hypothetical protein
VKMAFLLWARACGTGDGRGGITSRQQSILLQRWGVLLQRQGILSGLRGSLCVLIDGAGEHARHSSEGVLEYGCHVLHFDYNGSWQQCTESRGNSENGRDVGLCDRANR